MLRFLRSLLGLPSNRADFEDRMSEEMRFHIDSFIEDLVRSGLSPQEASRRARIEFGHIDSIKQDCRQARGLQLLDELSRNLRQSARLLSKTPAFTLTAILPLAFCLGANLAIFALLDGVLLRPLPFPDPGRLVLLYKTYPNAGVLRDGASPANLYERRGRIAAFSHIAISHPDAAIVGEPGATVREDILLVSTDFFSTLGVQPIFGRAFQEDEMTYETDRVAILTHDYWTRHFHSDPAAVGRQIRMDGQSRTIVGILPPGFTYLSSKAVIYTPYASAPNERGPAQRHSGRGGELIARLHPSTTIEAAQSQIDAFDASVAHEYAHAAMMAAAGYRTKIVNLHADHVASIRPTLLLLQTGVFFLLLIGSVNLVNLLLVRASARNKELAVRLALGAGRWHIVGEVITETAMLTSLGGLLSLFIAAGAIPLLAALGTEHLPFAHRITFDYHLASIAMLASVLTGFFAGVPVAWLSLRGSVGAALQGETRGGTAGHAAQRLRHGFMVAQIALAFVLLSAAGLLRLSLERVGALSLGFPSDHLLSGHISLPWPAYPQPQMRLTFTENLLTTIANQPGVHAAGIVSNLPLSGNNTQSGVNVVSRPLKPGELPRVPFAYSVGGSYFDAVRVPLLEGRLLDAADSRRPDRVCVVDEIFARHYWPSGGAIGERIFLGPVLKKDTDAFTIVGVVGRVKQTSLSETTSQGSVYLPYGHRADNNFYIVARTAHAPDTLNATLARIVRQIDPDLPINDVRSMETRITESLTSRRAPTLLAAVFAAASLLLASFGTYGVLSYAVSRRRREIGVRVALGAPPNAIRMQFLVLGLRLLLGGTCLGTAGAWAAGLAMQKLLYDLPPLYWPNLAAAASVMLVATLAACLIPSHRAARVSPIAALSG
ncbi:MAG: ABC transporter permease [Acidobacteria bacterium]|nr:ABC transporter permease [Acidobacteriota bacterium]